MGILISMFERCCGWKIATKETAVIVNKAVDLLRMDSSMYCEKCKEDVPCEGSCDNCEKRRMLHLKNKSI